MIKRIEEWFRKIVSEEITVARKDFARVEGYFASDIASIEATFRGVGIKFDVVETSVESELRALESRLTLKLNELISETQTRIEGEFKRIESTISKELDHWKADEDTRKQDEALRKQK